MLHFERVGGFADLTLKGLPVQRDQVVITLGLHFGRLPCFQAVEMHESHSPRTLAGNEVKLTDNHYPRDDSVEGDHLLSVSRKSELAMTYQNETSTK